MRTKNYHHKNLFFFLFFFLSSLGFGVNSIVYDYSITKTSTSNTFTPNQNLTYTIKIQNNSSTVTMESFTVEDVLSTITALSADGTNKTVFSNSNIAVTAVAGTTSSSVGTFSASGDLLATGVKIAPNDFITYTITAKVNSGIVGPIVNTATSKSPQNDIKSSALTINSVAPSLSLSKIVDKSTYGPGDTLIYTITLQNTGSGIAYNYKLNDYISSLNLGLANAGGVSASDITAVPFSSWNILASLGSGSTNSISSLIKNGGVVSNTDLSDVVTIFPGEKIVYTITGVTKATSISNISNVANLLDSNNNSVTSSTALSSANTLADNATAVITKVPLVNEYTPGETIAYTITVSNPTNNFMNNLEIKDYITKIMATQLDGTQGSAFSSWDLVVNGITGVGTAPGTNLLNQTGDLNIIADIGPSGSITYTLTAKTKLTTVGTILDESTDDNVTESGVGVKMSSPILDVAKNVDNSEYTPGDYLTYTLDVSNPGDGYATNVNVVDNLANIKTTLIDGTQGSAYSSWVITANIYDVSSGTPVLITDSSETSYPGFNLNSSVSGGSTDNFVVTNAVIGPNRLIRYTIQTLVNPKAIGTIKNTATINGSLKADKSSKTRASKISITKDATDSYAVGTDTVIEYTVVVSNDLIAGIAKSVAVSDDISGILATLLDGSGSVNPFSSWIIEAPTLVGEATKSTGAFPVSNKNLSDIVDISPGGSVTYKILATLKTPTNTNIVYGPIQNKAKANSLTATAATYPKLPNLNISKTAVKTSFRTSGVINFKVTVTNTGEGYANNAKIQDILDPAIYTNVQITGVATGIGTITGILNNQLSNLDATVNIAPGGSITYYISATVNPTYTGLEIVNSASIKDVQNDLSQTTFVTVTRDDDIMDEDHLSVDISKSSPSRYFAPGGYITYNITATNNLDDEKAIRVEDLLSKITATYANNLTTNNVTDLQNQLAFDSWDIYRNIAGNGEVQIATTSKVDLNDEVTVPAGSEVQYRVVAKVNERVVSTKISNTVNVYDNNSKLLGQAAIDHNIIAPGGGVTRTVDKSFYTPGDTITYTITAKSTGPGYQNNVEISELISGLQIDLIDGTTGNPFNGQFTVKKVVTNQTTGTEEVFTMGPQNNTDLVGVVDIKPNETLQYVIQGVVRPDAIGVIDNDGLITEPHLYNLQLTKSVSPTVYKPGDYITYSVVISNNSKGNAKDISVNDDLGSLTVVDSTGNTVIALSEITLDIVNSTATGYKANLGSPILTNGILTATPDIPIGGKITYKIKAKVNEKAVGNIINVAEVDGDAVSNQLGPAAGNLGVTKTIKNYYKADGTTVLSGGYTPGGYIEYQIVVKNTGSGILNNLPFIDDIANIKTTYSTGLASQPAFDSWTVSYTQTAGVSTNADIGSNIELIQNSTKTLNTNIDIHPGSQITYVIKAKVSKLAVGTIGNTVSVNGVTKSVSSKMLSPTIVHTKVAYESANGAVKTQFYPGDSVVYKIKIQNTGNGTSYLQTYQDLIANIVGEIAESPTVSSGTKVSVFDGDPIVSITATNDGVTTINTLDKVINQLSSVTIAPGGEIDIQISGTLKKNLLGAFTNTSLYGSDSKSVTINPYTTTLSVAKKIVKLNGVAFTPGMQYKPGDSIEYSIDIQNTGKAFYNNLAILDNVANLKTTLAGNVNGAAFENILIVPTLVNTSGFSYLKNSNGTQVTGNVTNGNLSHTADLAPGDSIKYVITANIVKNAKGTIPANVVTVGGTQYSTSTIGSKPSTITSSKTLLSPTDKIYGPGENIKYKLSVTNTGEGFGNNIKVADALSAVKTDLIGGTVGAAFTSWTFDSVVKTYSDMTFSDKTVVQTQPVNNQDLNTQIDIAPGGTVEITITVKTSILAMGTITNTATINNEVKTADAVTARAADTSDISFDKKLLVDNQTTYSPNGTIGFRILVNNNSTNAIAKNINIIDTISSIKVGTISGSLVQALQNGWTISVAKVGTTPTQVASTIGSSGDINGALTLGPGQGAIITITGKVTDTAIGDIVNTATATYGTGTIPPKTVTYTTKPGVGSITKVVDSPNYSPEGTLNYTISIKNSGEGYLNGVQIIDDILDITSDLVGTPSIGKAFSSYTVKSTTHTSSNTSVVQDNTHTSGYKGTAIIYPGDTLNITLSAVVNKNVVGTIKNISNLLNSDNSTIGTSEADATSYPADVKMLKSVDKTTYISKDTITYTITVGNIGKGWAKGVEIKDVLSTIMAETSKDPIKAFKSWTITPSIRNNVLISDLSSIVDTDLDMTVDIGSNSAVDFTIVAILNENTISDIINTATTTYGSTNLSSSATISAKQGDFIISKAEKNSKIQYKIGDTINYVITVTNGSAAIINHKIVDELTKVMVNTTSGNQIGAFKNWRVVSATRSTNNTVDSFAPQSLSSTDDVLVVTDLDAHEIITIEVEATINQKVGTSMPISLITNKAFIENPLGSIKDYSNEVILLPNLPNIETTKVISKIGGAAPSANNVYKPGDEVEYTITIKNTGDGVASRFSLSDVVNNIKVNTTIGEKVAFTSWSWKVQDFLDTDNINMDTKDIPDNTDLHTVIDLGPNKEIVIILKGITDKTAVGNISQNIVTVNGVNTESDILTLEDTNAPILNKTQSFDSYNQGDTITYTITVQNPNLDQWIKDVKVYDYLSYIATENTKGLNEKAFSNWSITKSDLGKGTTYSQFTTNTLSKVDLTETLELAPSDIVTFIVEATINTDIIGDIKNTVSLTYLDHEITKYLPDVSVTSVANKASITLEKTPYVSLYAPGENIGYDLIISNTTSAVANNVEITDIISSIKSSKVGSNDLVQAFKSWTISVEINGDTIVTDVSNIPTAGDINSVLIDIGKNTTVTIKIRGIANDAIYNSLENTANVIYNSENLNDTAIINPKEPKLVLTKIVNSDTYAPNDELLYTITVQNIGEGVATDVTLTDEIGKINISQSGTQTNGLAFVDWEVVREVGPYNLKPDTYTDTFDLLPGQTVQVSLKGIVSPNALGDIINTAILNYKDTILEESATSKSLGSNLSLVKSVDKAIYSDSDTITYTVVLKNSGEGWGNDIQVIDEISKINDTFGNTAFNPVTDITWTSTSNLSTVSMLSTTSDLNATVDIAPNSEITFTIITKLNQDISSEIKNTAYFTEEEEPNYSNDIFIETIPSGVSILKSVDRNIYIPGETVTYTLTITNNQNIYTRDVLIEDSPNNILVSTNVLGSDINPFTSWKLISVTGNKGSIPKNITPNEGVESVESISILTDMKANEVMTIIFEATINDGMLNPNSGVPLDIIKNIANISYDGKSDSNEISINPGNPNVISKKVITKLSGNPYVGQGYDPKDIVTYQITLENIGSKMSTKLTVKDIISEIEAEVSGDTIGKVFSEWSVDISKTKPTTLINPVSIPNNTDIDMIIDLDTGDKVTITIDAKIADNILGIIPKNTVLIADTKVDSETLTPEMGDLIFTKEILEGLNYIQSGEIKYQLTITNQSLGFINDVLIVDEISKIMATNLDGNLENPFKSWKVERSNNDNKTKFKNQPDYFETQDIDGKVDIAPKDVITYLITLVVKDNIVGDINNVGVVNYKNTAGDVTINKSVTSKAIPGDITILKEALVTEYVPGSEIGFRITVSNISKTSVANNVLVKDTITDILANKVGGGKTQAFKPGWKITATLSGDDVANSNVDNINNLADGVNLDNVSIDLGKNTKAIIDVVGNAADNIYGEIRNIAYFEYPDGNQSGKYDPPIENTKPTALLTKIVDESNYISGDKLTYTIKVENTSGSVIPGFVLSDAIGLIEGEISGIGNPSGIAFSSWQRESIDVPITSALLSEVISGNTYEATLDIGPKDTITLILSGVTASNVFGEITNTVTGKNTDLDLSASISSVGELGDVIISKFVNTENYIPGQEVTYTLVIENISESWVGDAVLVDNFSQITTILFGGSTGQALELIDAKVTMPETGNNKVQLYLDDGNLKAEIDIEAKAKIYIEVISKVSELASSSIDNSAQITYTGKNGNTTVPSNLVTIKPLPIEVSLDKEVDLTQYEFSKELTYTITVSNSNEANLNNIVVNDRLVDILAINNLGDLVNPFESGITISRDILPINSVVVKSQSTLEGVIEDNLSMTGNSKIIYTIKGLVKDGIVGDIINTANLTMNSQIPDGEPVILSDTVTSNPLNPTIGVSKNVVSSIENDLNVINGELVTYTIDIITDRTVFNVQMIDRINSILSTQGDYVFATDTIKLISVQENGANIPYTGTISGESSEIIIDRINSKATVIIEAAIKDDVSLIAGEEIKNIVYVNFDQAHDGTMDLDIPLEDFAVVIPSNPELELTKVSTEDEILLGDQIEYTITVKNKGIGEATHFTIIDKISEITASSNSGSQIPVFTEWTTTGVAGPNSYIGTLPAANTDMNITDAKIAAGESLIYTIKGKTSIDLNTKSIENIVSITALGMDTLEAKAETKIKKPIITINKEAGLREASVGGFVPYSILITNNESQEVKNIYLKDTPPAGFKFILDSLQIVENGEKVGTIKTNYSGDTVVIGPFNLEPKQQLEVVYITKVSLGVVRGIYKNTALVVNTAGTLISNEDTAQVEVVEDPLFETVTVIGKVFHDRDGDGTQDDARATGIKIKQSIKNSDYVPNSTFMVKDGKRKAIKDRSVPIEAGIEFKEILYGRESEKEELDKNKIEVYIGLKDIKNLGDINVTTKEGTNITLTKDNKIITEETGLKKKGMTSQNIVLKREILKRSSFKNNDNQIKYYQKITIMNTGLQEEGIPGVRVTNVEGLVMITDQYGRFHIPEVSDKKGKNYILKVDESTVPVGSIFTTENPKVQRLGTTILKYNFGVALPKITYKDLDKNRRDVKIELNPEILFKEKSDEFKPVTYKSFFEGIKNKTKKGDRVEVILKHPKVLKENTDLNTQREKALLKKVKEYIDKNKLQIELIDNTKGGMKK